MPHVTPLMNESRLPQSTVKPLAVCISALLLTACATTPTQTTKTVTTTRSVGSIPPRGTQSQALVQANAALLDDDSLDELEGLLEATDMTMVENNSLLVQRYGNVWDRMRSGFKMNPNQYDPRIEAQKSWFVSRQDYLNRLSARASRYLYHTVREAERRNIPTELALLPVIESSYDPLANSNAAAVGLWQFIPSTGRIYGLNQSASFDGRRDVIESTRAAYDFLTTLYNQFGSWELALAAYNAGPGRIQSAINYNQARGLSTDYWSLKLPTETMNYVPRFLAVAQIVKSPNNYNIYLPAIANRQHFRSVPANVGVTLNDVSNLTDVSYDELRALNPGLLSGMVDASAPNRILIPNDINTNLDAKISKLKGSGFSGYASNSYTNSNPTYTSPTNYPSPTVNPNPSTYQKPVISSNTSTKLPSSSNDLAAFANSMVKNQTTMYVAPMVTAKTTEPPLTIIEQKQVTQQMVKENTLPTTSAQITANNTIVQEPPLSPTEKAIIAQQIEQTSPQVAQAVSPVDGNIKINAIQTQQSVLDAKGETKQLSYGNPAPLPITTTVNTTPMSESELGLPAVPKKTKPTGTRSTYQVKSGDNLGGVATRMGVKASDIADWNQIDPNKGLLAGSTLYLYDAKPIAEPTAVKPLPKTTSKKPTAAAESYIVQSGDTLLDIANQHDLSLFELAKYNNLPTNYQVKIKQTLWLIPNKVKPVAVPKPVVKPTTTIPTYPTTVYKVKAGDGLIALANSYDISTSELASINGLATHEDLLVGQVLKVPAPKKVVAKPVQKPSIKAEPEVEKSKTTSQTTKIVPKATNKKSTTKVTTTKPSDIKVTTTKATPKLVESKAITQKATSPKAILPKTPSTKKVVEPTTKTGKK